MYDPNGIMAGVMSELKELAMNLFAEEVITQRMYLLNLPIPSSQEVDEMERSKKALEKYRRLAAAREKTAAKEIAETKTIEELTEMLINNLYQTISEASLKMD